MEPGEGFCSPWASQSPGDDPNIHLQPVYHGPLDLYKAAVSWPLLPRRWFLCHNIRRQTLPFPWHLYLHSSPGRRSPKAGGKGIVHPCLTCSPSQSPQLPNEGTLMAVYDKSGYSHSETSLESIIYLSKKVRLPALSSTCYVPLSEGQRLAPASLTSYSHSSVSPGQNCHLRG